MKFDELPNKPGNRSIELLGGLLSVTTQVKGHDAEILRQSRSLTIPQVLAGGQGVAQD